MNKRYRLGEIEEAVSEMEAGTFMQIYGLSTASPNI